MASLWKRIGRRGKAEWHKGRCWLYLRGRVTGRIKLRGETARITIHPSFRCDGDLWLGVYSDEGSISIEAGVSASGPLTVTAIKPIRIGAGALFGPNVFVTDHYHGDPRDAASRAMTPSLRPLHSPGTVVIERDVLFGANSVVLAPVLVGHGAIVAANAVVKGTVPAMAVYTGLTTTGRRDDAALRSHSET